MKKILFVLGSVAAALVTVLAILAGTSSDVVRAQEPTAEVPFWEEWQSSAHAKADAQAFVNWNANDPAVVPAACARCHSTPGYQDYVGADGSPAGTVEQDVPVGTVIGCTACHNQATLTMTSVVMPSGIEITGLGDEARCMQCHQGRASGVQVDESIAKANLTDPDTVSPDLGFTNIHYFAAAATKYGTIARGGYQYEGRSYDANFAHVDGFDTCIGCHNPHTLQVRVEACQGCHTGVTAVEDLKEVRMPGSLVDYDGDGNVEEGIYYEIEGLQNTLLQAIQIYAAEKAGSPIAYSPASYPYFFLDTNNNGQVDEDETDRDNGYNAWTARLARAAYNYQLSLKDPGMFAHGGKYIIQLLYDSTEDLNGALPEPVDLSQAHRIDHGHFAGSEAAFRRWDADGEIPATCSKCHSAAGLPLFLKDNATISQPLANGFQCATCHNDLTEFTRYEVTEVQFPSGAVIDSGNANMNLCMNCHQGRESTVSVNKLIEGLDKDTVSDKLRFLNIHYFAAGATRFGTEAKGAYEYDGKTYVGLFTHVPAYSSCTDCHSAHGLAVKAEECGACHTEVTGAETLAAIRLSPDDFDGDGDTKEGIAGEIDTLRQALYMAMQDYAQNVAQSTIVYDPHTYPYFLVDSNGNGQADPDEATGANGYKAWTPRLLQAAYNYQYSTKDPGAFAHNGRYILQVLYDSLEDLGAQAKVDMAGMIRPK